jgi:septal ring factor EnvC (AmiA/AmiB activator)
MPARSPYDSSALIITGMHRSGTSLTAALLQNAGLSIGQRLMPANQHNVKGYFENLDFYELHRSILRSQSISEDGWTLQEKIDVEDFYVAQARKAIHQNAVSSAWGWKDPRTTLFLDFWTELLPKANFLVVYRSPWDVIDSLYRRGTDAVLQDQPDLAAKIWLHYNRKMLDFCARLPDRCLLVNVQTIAQSSSALIETINQKFNTNLTTPVDSLYEPGLLNVQKSDSHRPNLIHHFCPEAVELYQTLEEQSWYPENGSPESSWCDQITPAFYKLWAFQDWIGIRNLERQNLALRSSLEQVNLQSQHAEMLELDVPQQQAELLTQAQTEIEQLKLQLQQSHVEHQQTQGLLKQSREELHQTQVELDQTTVRLDSLEMELERSQNQLHQTEAVLERSQVQLGATEATLEQSQIQLHQTQIKLEQSQINLYNLETALESSQQQLHQAQAEAGQTRECLYQTEAQLERSQKQIRETEAVLEQLQEHLCHSRIQQEQAEAQIKRTEAVLSQSQIRQQRVETELEQAKTKLQQTELILIQSQSQLQQTKGELQQYQYQIARLQFQQFLVNNSTEPNQIQYELLVWEAWYAYRTHDLNKMAQCLRQSLKYSSFLQSETVVDWAKTFSRFSLERGEQIQTNQLVDSNEWKQLTQQIVSIKSRTFQVEAPVSS